MLRIQCKYLVYNDTLVKTWKRVILERRTYLSLVRSLLGHRLIILCTPAIRASSWKFAPFRMTLKDPEFAPPEQVMIVGFPCKRINKNSQEQKITVNYLSTVINIFDYSIHYWGNILIRVYDINIGTVRLVWDNLHNLWISKMRSDIDILGRENCQRSRWGDLKSQPIISIKVFISLIMIVPLQETINPIPEISY